MTARRVSDIVIALMRAKKAGAKLKGNSAFERELQAWIDGPEIPLNYDWEPGPVQPTPPNDKYTLDELRAIQAAQGGIIRCLD